MKRKPILFLILFLFTITIFLNRTLVEPVKAKTATSVIKWDKHRQYVDGFGGSGAFQKPSYIMQLPEPEKTKILDMIFSQEKGIGLSIVRNLVGDGVAASTIEPEPGKFVWDQPDWSKKKTAFDKDQIWFMKEAKKRGVSTFLSSVWSPPAWMKTNNSVLGTNNGKLKQEHYQDFANYLAEYVFGYKEHFDLDISYISIANEPNYGPDYSGAIWTPEELHIFIRDYLGPTFERRNVPAKIVMPEHMNFTEEYALPALNDPITEKYIDVVAAHAYGIGTDVPTFPVSKEKGKTIWQTEYMNQGDALQTYEFNTIKDGLRHANLIGDMFHKTGISAYFWWWPVAVNNADGSDLIRLTTDDDGEVNGMFRVFKRYYTFGNYSRFIRPGYIMIESDKSPVEDVQITAYKDPSTDNFTIVAVNNQPTEQQLELKLDNFPNTKELIPYRTSGNENLKKLDTVKVKGNGKTVTIQLSSESVTTFIPKEFELPAFDDLKDIFSSYEAEENDGQSPEMIAPPANQKKGYIEHVRNGDYIKYTNVNFADGTANGQPGMKHILSMDVLVHPINGGTIEVRLDDPYHGNLVGEITVSGKGSNDWITTSTMIDTNSDTGAYGIHDMYLVFKGENRKKLFAIDKLTFNDGIEKPIELKKHVLDFENGTTEDWTGRAGTEMVEVTDVEAYSGSYSLKTSNRTSSWHGPTMDITNMVVKGKEYEFSTYFRFVQPPATESKVKLTLEVTDFGGTKYIALDELDTNRNDWFELKGNYVLDPDITTIKLYVETSNPNDSFYIDDVIINPVQ